MRHAALLLLVVVFSVGKSFGKDVYSFHKITTKEGLSHSTIYSITQDYKGFIWIGSREGLNRYDSYGIVTYYSEPGNPETLNSNVITALLSTKDSSLYVGADGGLNLYDDERNNFRRIQFEGSSLGMIYQLYESQDRSIYICSARGLFKLSRQKQITQIMSSASVIGISEFRKNIFWALTSTSIIMINEDGEVIRRYPRSGFTGDADTPGEIFSCIFKDSEEQIWIGTQNNGLFNYVPKEDKFLPIVPKQMLNPTEANVIKTINEDAKGNIWLGTESGLFIYNKQKKRFNHYTQSFNNSAYTLSDKSIYAIYRSRENIMWIGTYFGGVNYVKANETGFYEIRPDRRGQGLGGKAVSQIIKDENNRLWIATEDGGITVFEKDANDFEYIIHDPNDPNSLSSNNIHALQDDSRGNIWIGGLLGGVSRFDIKTNKLHTYKHNPDDPTSILHNNVFSILRDSRGKLWIGTWAGVNVFDYEKNNFEKFEKDNFSGRFIYHILEDHEGNIWFCSRNSGLFFYDLQKDTVVHYGIEEGNHGLSSASIISAFQDSKQRLWFGSLNGGLINWSYETQRFTAVTVNDGLPNNNIYGILEDDHGALWVSSNKGLAKYNPETKEIVSFDHSHGISNRQFNFRSYFKDDGWMYFGSVNGLYYFHPDSISFNHLPANVHFTDFKLFNSSVETNEDGVLGAHIDETHQITLAYSQNVITFEFLAINYFSPASNKFSYYLEGFEEEWGAPDFQRTATYTNLSPDSYVFHVKAANNDGVWSPERSIRLIVKPPLWKSPWAIALYTVLCVALIFLARLYIVRRHMERMTLHLERIEKEKMRELNQHKLNFFTFISHEFKTPLTLIIASIDKFLNADKVSEDDVQEYHLIKKYAKKLHLLIEQLMEFRKVESEHATLDLSKGDIVSFLQDSFSAFIPLFNKKNIDYQIATNTQKCDILFDEDKVEKIVANLISNAVKHTPEFGKIEMAITISPSKQSEAHLVQIRIADSGNGLSEGEADKIFSPFYQSPDNKLTASGSGVGLALVKSLIEFLNGKINLESIAGEGTSVTIELPCQAATNDSKAIGDVRAKGKKNSYVVDEDLFFDEVEIVDHAGEKEQSEQYDLMIVEDNNDLLKFLVNHFAGKYRIAYAKNGRDALDKIGKNMPDIVISDVMMPYIDGITLCEKIKSDLNTSHIPFILLSARSAVDHRLEGLDVGADAYIAKPFNLKELELLVKNMLDSRNCLKKHFLKHGNINDCDKIVNNRDQHFINNLTDIVYQHLSDQEFNITTFTREAGVSRTLLHLKLKKLANLNASDFIKTIRLQKAAELLKEGLTVSEVAFQVGFNDPNYFSRSFKKKFDVTPSEYRAGDSIIREDAEPGDVNDGTKQSK